MIINKLSEIMGRKRVRMAELQKWTGLSHTTIIKLYYDKSTSIKLDTMNRICNALDISVGELFEHIPD